MSLIDQAIFLDLPKFNLCSLSIMCCSLINSQIHRARAQKARCEFDTKPTYLLFRLNNDRLNVTNVTESVIILIYIWSLLKAIIQPGIK
ncbi:MAG: hypothetical protein COW03_03825 [Cytophagales bacterium CG12_big_fil_rev_8_21_14_0_65_40_12]|nr:MAG: hypothetical protein COW03_03825 [Cytophagales bacterium CG12_big_fil_rev_8_21_14_0_65_40_12]PIW03694.1 MAG: hypothetical protein COW40_13565 [Cytophagales bacterium CG17_big_fil_post_rev_8_21_14_2_50_40_13]